MILIVTAPMVIISLDRFDKDDTVVELVEENGEEDDLEDEIKELEKISYFVAIDRTHAVNDRETLWYDYHNDPQSYNFKENHTPPPEFIL